MRRWPKGLVPCLCLVGLVACSGSNDDELESDSGPRMGDTDSGTGVGADAGMDAQVVVPIQDAGKDASPPEQDSGPAVLAIVLSAVSTTVTTNDTSVSANVMGQGITQVAFYEGQTLLGTDTTSPFEQPLSFGFFDNGMHTYTGVVTGADGQVTSLPLTLTVNVPPNGYFVNPSTGDDTNNNGTQGAPYKTLQKAAQVTLDNQYVYLQDGNYILTTNQPTFQVNFKPGVHLYGMSKTGVVFQANASANQVNFTGGGSIENVQFDTFNQGVGVSGSGTFTMRNVQFANVNTPLLVNGNLQVTLDGTERPMFVNLGNSVNQAVWLDGTSQTHFKGDVANIGLGAGLFFARGNAMLTIEDSNFTNIDRPLFMGYDNAKLALINTVLDDMSWGPQTIQGVIEMGGQQQGGNTAQYGVELTDCTLRNSSLVMIRINRSQTKLNTIAVKLTRTTIESNQQDAIYVRDDSIPYMAADDIKIELVDSVIKNNLGNGINAFASKVEVTGGEISGNGNANTENEILLSNATYPNSLKLRGVTLGGNGLGHAISVDGSNTSVLDLGTAADLGNNTFSNVPASRAVLNLVAPIAGQAIGNTWLPNVQTADAAGHFPAGKTIPASTTGQNVTTAAGASVVVSQ
ncbi:MAG: hypothetical protein QM778_26580 [Myxococcales bacterium]